MSGGIEWRHVRFVRGKTRSAGAVLAWSRMGKRLSAVGAVAAGLGGPAGADARARFFHFNACGNVCNHGRVSPVAEAIKNSILDLRPYAVS